MRGFFIVFLLFFAALTEAKAQDCRQNIPGTGFQFGTGESLSQQTMDELRPYVKGFINGIFLAPLVGAPAVCLKWLRDCLSEMNDVQLANIVKKYVSEHPENWHWPASGLTYNALHETCRKLGFAPPRSE